jgi:hypothetical protein
MIEWRELLDELNVEWRDKGKNCSRGNINISCPFCGDDPSFHLAISENKDAYYCYRDPAHHSGSSTSRLLIALGLSHADISFTLNQYGDDRPVRVVPKKPASVAASTWTKFGSAADSELCVTYLRDRGFPTPVAISRQYDLRIAGPGKWAQRLLLPIQDDGAIVSWTGRALRPGMEPKYLTETTDAGNFLYLPRSIRETLVVVEGPMDALKIAVATNNLSISAVAILGKGYFNKLDKIAKLAEGCTRILLALDIDVSISTSYEVVYELASRVSCPVNNLGIPYGYKDAAELELEEIQEWIR